MAENVSNNKRIAKNTLFLYFRMILIMGVTLYTSRVVLDKLGIVDYGLYATVGSAVGMLSFLNGTLSIGTSRFLTYELGAGNKERLKNTFSTAFYTHLILAFIVILAMETVGVWFFYNKLEIPAERLDACMWVLQFSILTTVVAITQVPYTAAVMAHEHMGIYAYVSIFEAIAKLLVCYLLTISAIDRLVFYAALIAAVQLITAMFYRFYCISQFEESKLRWIFDKGILRSLMGFSGWNIMANITETLKLQGIIVLLNMFFSAPVVAAQALANQVSAAMMQFVNNFRTALNPQIIKLYAAGDREGSKQLTLKTTVYCFDLILMLGLPAIMVMNQLLDLWLVEVPEYAVIFIQYIIVRNIIGTFSTAFYIPMMAANRIKSNSMAAVYLGIGEFVLLYILLKLGFGVMWVQYMSLFLVFGFSFVVKPYILYKEIDYTIKELLGCYWNCAKVLLLAIAIALPSLLLLGEGMFSSAIKGLNAFMAVVIASYVFLDKSAKEKLHSFVLQKIRGFKNTLYRFFIR